LNPEQHTARLPDAPESLHPIEWGHGEPTAGWCPFYKHMIRQARRRGMTDPEIARVLMRYRFKAPLEARAGHAVRVLGAFDRALARSRAHRVLELAA